MKFRLLLSLLAIFLIAKGLGWCQSVEPTKLVCTAQASQGFRFGFWDVCLDATFSDKQTRLLVNEQWVGNISGPVATANPPLCSTGHWYSERDSRKAALKDCDRVMKAQEKRWKQLSKSK